MLLSELGRRRVPSLGYPRRCYAPKLCISSATCVSVTPLDCKWINPLTHQLQCGSELLISIYVPAAADTGVCVVYLCHQMSAQQQQPLRSGRDHPCRGAYAVSTQQPPGQELLPLVCLLIHTQNTPRRPWYHSYSCMHHQSRERSHARQEEGSGFCPRVR